MPSYSQSRKDFEFLESIAELSDQVELDSERIYLMQEPTKARAARMYEMGIRQWFDQHGLKDSRTWNIAQRHNIEATPSKRV